jgi:hypothetical protein
MEGGMQGNALSIACANKQVESFFDPPNRKTSMECVCGKELRNWRVAQEDSAVQKEEFSHLPHNFTANCQNLQFRF